MHKHMLLALLLFCPIQLAGQPVKKFDPLAPPHGSTLMCQDIVPTAADSADVVLRFLDDGESYKERETIIGYSTTGRVLYLTLTAIDSVEGRPGVLHGIAVRFLPTTIGAHTTDGGRDESAVEVALSSNETKQALALAEKFWELRCRPKSAPQALLWVRPHSAKLFERNSNALE